MKVFSVWRYKWKSQNQLPKGPTHPLHHVPQNTARGRSTLQKAGAVAQTYKHNQGNMMETQSYRSVLPELADVSDSRPDSFSQLSYLLSNGCRNLILTNNDKVSVIEGILEIRIWLLRLSFWEVEQDKKSFKYRCVRSHYQVRAAQIAPRPGPIFGETRPMTPRTRARSPTRTPAHTTLRCWIAHMVFVHVQNSISFFLLL